MGRGAYAFRDLDEELHGLAVDDRDPYVPHHSPPDAKSKSATSTRNLNGLSDSTMLKLYVDHYKAQRRRKLLGGALFVGVALLGIVPMLIEMQSVDANDNALDLAISAPYRSMRVRGDKDPEYDPLAHENDEDQWIGREPEVGDVDPRDAHANEGEEGADAPLDSMDADHDPINKRLRVHNDDDDDDADDKRHKETSIWVGN